MRYFMSDNNVQTFSYKVDTKLKNGYDSDKLWELINSFDFLDFNEIQLIWGQMQLYIGLDDKNAKKEIKNSVNDILNGTHPIIRLKH